MAKGISNQGLSVFEKIKQTDENGNEFWMARQLAKALDYTDFRNFLSVIEKAKEACTNSGQAISNHLVEFNEVVAVGSGATHSYPSYKLSRYACYLIVQNADPSKEIVALGQSYFAVQTRLQEITQMEAYNRLNTEDEKRVFLRNEMAKHNTHLAAAAKNAGVISSLDYAIFQNHGFANFFTYFKMRLVGVVFSLYIFSAQFFFGLRSSKKVGGKFGAAHVVEYLLVFRKPFSFVYSFSV